MVSIVDFLTLADQTNLSTGALFDATYAFEAAQQASLEVELPAGLLGLKGFRPRSGLWLRGAATRATRVKQIDAQVPAFEVRSDATTGQLLSLNLSGFVLLGADAYASAATFKAFQAAGGVPAPAMRLYANDNWAITNSYFEFFAQNTYNVLTIEGLSAQNVYDNRFVIASEGTRGVGARTGGPYNVYDLFLTQCDSFCIEDVSSDSDFYVVGENCMRFLGQRNTINARLEGIVVDRAASNVGIFDGNHNNTYIDPLVNLFSFDLGKLDFAFQSFSGSVWINPQVVGEGARSPLYPFGDAFGKLTVIGGRSLAAKIEDYHADVPGNDQRTFANFTLVGQNDGLSNRVQATVHKVLQPGGNLVTTLDPNWRSIEVNASVDPLPYLQLDMVAAPPAPGRKLTIFTVGEIASLVYAGGSFGDISALPSSLPAGGILEAVYSVSANKWFKL